MNKTLKKIVAIALSLIMILSVSAVCFSVFAEDAVIAENTDETENTESRVEEHPEHWSFAKIFAKFFQEMWDFIKYLFYDVWRGEPVPNPTPAPTIYAEANA